MEREKYQHPGYTSYQDYYDNKNAQEAKRIFLAARGNGKSIRSYISDSVIICGN